jgi:capsular polysaccharide transport system permease protein
MLREVHTRYGRDNLGFLWFVAEPLLFCVGVVTVWSLTKAPYEHGVSVLAFVMTGYIPFFLWRHCVFRSILCFRANGSLLYHRQIGVMDFLTARILLEIYGSISTFGLLALVFGMAGQYQLPVDLGLFYLGWLVMILYSAALAIIAACLSEMYDWVEKIVAPSTYLILPVSGAFFMVDWLPYKAQKYALLIPSVDAYEIIRAGQFGEGVRTHFDLAYVLLACLLLLTIGLILTRSVRKYIEVE